MIFLSKFSPKLGDLYQLRTYDRLQVTGVIRNTFQDKPWIEVTDFEVLSERLDTAVLSHLYRGEKMMSQRLWKRAIAELSLIPGGPVPQPALQTAYKKLGVCLLRIGEATLAKTYLNSASSLANGGDPEVENLLAIARTHPDQAIDRTVDSRGLKDHERPMWEAFDDGGEIDSQSDEVR